MARIELYEKLDIVNKLGLVEGWKRDGLTDEQIARNLGVSKHTLIKWKKNIPDFLDAIKKGKEVSDYELENALHKRAVGYYYEEETVTNKGEVVKIKRYEHANPTSLIFALKNRLPHKYRDKVEQEITNRNIEINIGDYVDDD
ncbi:helix-turn-helix domain-containing protein [Staphylococcus aureus]|uniref:helix-turn-helix domain-containing protein n=1 Tax=Staphylococcus aureus TaxID=1280 RepID=UPI00202FD2E6|nr:helix-turn-helix domain-containing protein [Staphylococcus aureus]MCM0451567.1 helix-turn-helix domain-containing protein [Staphylococcus aureus]MCM0456757.1 helix-turn-helix domain-containing protein [Staphylococcus aureus]MCM0461918.1 helix-turn-helix domain-containing protein [Staphylococcus aureus]MCM0462573.1 helix-turn-helix domain-containing protein [Staphylococcus aureus]MCM0469737.1 helix-turn-helix domain-containing protein [Staphylococcus aureus]